MPSPVGRSEPSAETSTSDDDLVQQIMVEVLQERGYPRSVAIMRARSMRRTVEDDDQTLNDRSAITDRILALNNLGIIGDERTSALLIAAVGHHYFPREIFQRGGLGFSPEALKVFEGRTTGPLPMPHYNTTEHRAYTRAVWEFVRDWFGRHPHIRPNQMSADQARQFLDDLLRSRNPIIRAFNMRLVVSRIIMSIRSRGSDRQ